MWLEIMKSKRHNLGIYFDCDFNNKKVNDTGHAASFPLSYVLTNRMVHGLLT